MASALSLGNVSAQMSVLAFRRPYIGRGPDAEEDG